MHGRAAARGRDGRGGRAGVARRRGVAGDGEGFVGRGRLGWGALCGVSRAQSHARATAHRESPLPHARADARFRQDPVAYRVEYADGLKATMFLLSGLVGDFTFAARLKGQAEPLSTLFHLPPNPNVVYSAALMAQAERMFVTGRAPYPIERTLLTSGILAAAVRSLGEGGKRLATPQLAVRYQAPEESLFARE